MAPPYPSTHLHGEATNPLDTEQGSNQLHQIVWSVTDLPTECRWCHGFSASWSWPSCQTLDSLKIYYLAHTTCIYLSVIQCFLFIFLASDFPPPVESLRILCFPDRFLFFGFLIVLTSSSTNEVLQLPWIRCKHMYAKRSCEHYVNNPDSIHISVWVPAVVLAASSNIWSMSGKCSLLHGRFHSRPWRCEFRTNLF